MRLNACRSGGGTRRQFGAIYALQSRAAARQPYRRRKAMGISKKVAGLVMTGLLFSAGYAPARAQTSDDQATRARQPSAAVFAGPYSALTPGVASRLPSFLKASDIAGMSPTLEDLQVQSQA